MFAKSLFIAAALFSSVSAHAQERPFGTLREQAEVRQHWLQERLETVLPRLMRQHGISMWVLPMREYNEDPVFRALVSPTTFAARRRTIYIFFDRGPERGVDRIALGGTSQGGLYEAVRGMQGTPDGRRQELWGPDQWQLFADVVRGGNPRNIAVNISHELSFADGLTAGEWEQMQEALGPDLLSRVVHADLLAVDYMATRVPGMRPVFERMTELVYDIIETAFSNEVITPGVTTTEDVVWWMRQRVNDLGLGSWFQPSVEVQRRGGLPDGDDGNTVIERGDVLHCDFGIVAYGLHTDTQHMGYVLREGETDVPEGLRIALGNANRLQDITMGEMHIGRTGDEVLAAALNLMRSEGLDGSIYSHPVGDHGHAAGSLIGLWDRQDGVPDRGQVPLIPSVYWSIELQATTPVAEWDGQRVRMALEEDAEQTAEGDMRWIVRRQTQFHLVR